MLEKTFALLRGYQPGNYLSDDVECFDEAEIQELGIVLRHLVYGPSKLRKRLQELGATITRTDFYAELTLISEIEDTFRANRNLILDHVFEDKAFLASNLTALAEFSFEFDPPVTNVPGQFFWENGAFSYSDAVAYYCMVRKVRPATIIEIGGGFSSLVALSALERNGVGRLIVVDPFPLDFLKTNSSIELIQVSAQDLELNFLENNLADNDILFIDSTHTVKHNSDCLHIYLRLLPFITKSVHVHAHDICLPGTQSLRHMRDLQRFWNEQYLLYAYMLRNPTIRVLYGSAYHLSENRALLSQFMHGRFPPGGGSLWFSQSSP